ncbi:putative RDD family membrane protein YckC [Flavobacterium nitrogenifigens]|uniref:RDD family membrane protein YckC n=2 Tax=Flavobacterium TaxID=237 RepID=A0ABR6QFF5_9FLAO|nr:MULTISPECIES: RDD family protein [Flavobacterium]MBB4803008.1 putative RDD family membrane protein YckC [Flavobacterium nitrogenifigens]MBB6387966.1 putative RDD family membrane protein YckC [Flavobacterium notoginsengisoli]
MSELSINTTQNVKINFIAASVGERLGAFFLDLFIMISYATVLSIVLFSWLNLGELMSGIDQWSRGAILVILYSPIILYSLVLESVFEGQSLGKKVVKIKVVKIDGYQAGFGDYLVRWFFRVIDFFSLFGLPGIIAVITSEKAQRLGDMAAGTAVITLKNKINISHTILEEIDDAYVPTYPLVIKLSDNDMRIIKETFQKAEAKHDHEIIYKLVAKIESFTGIKNQSGNNSDFIRTILKDYNFYTQHM